MGILTGTNITITSTALLIALVLCGCDREETPAGGSAATVQHTLVFDDNPDGSGFRYRIDATPDYLSLDKVLDAVHTMASKEEVTVSIKAETKVFEWDRIRITKAVENAGAQVKEFVVRTNGNPGIARFGGKDLGYKFIHDESNPASIRR